MITVEDLMVWVTDAMYVDEYRIRVEFNDGARGVADLRATVFGDSRAVFAELRDLEAFKCFRVAMDTIVWENGLDLAPEFLRDLVDQPVDSDASPLLVTVSDE